LFPFFIVIASIAGSLGRSEGGLAAINQFLRTLPPEVAELLRAPIIDVLSRQTTGGLLTFGIIVGLWSVGSFIETMRDILRRAYDSRSTLAFWRYRLGSMALIVGSVLLMLIAFTFQFVLTGAEQFVARIIPWADDALQIIGLSRIAPAVALFAALYLLFATLTPHRYRRGCPKWPGAVLTSAVWVLTTMALPEVISWLGGYDRTYGSLAGVMIALIFFFIVGLGFTMGAQLNAALAIVPKSGLKADEEQASGA
jgi:membrane protein